MMRAALLASGAGWQLDESMIGKALLQDYQTPKGWLSNSGSRKLGHADRLSVCLSVRLSEANRLPNYKRSRAELGIL